MAPPVKKNNEKKYQRTYIGKGTQVEGTQIVKVSISMEDLEQFIHKYKGKKYLTFEVAKMKDTDNYGETHTAYTNTEIKEEK